MGYYSDLGLALSGAGVKELNKQLELMDANSQVRSEMLDLLHYAEQHYKDDATGAEVWFWKMLKWYTCDPQYYPEIDFLDKFLDSLDEDDFYFVRIGENYDDTEVRGYFTENPFDLELARGITVRAS